MAVSNNFFSVEKTGYTKVSDLFFDVAYFMQQNGFTVTNASHNIPSDAVTFMTKITATVESPLINLIADPVTWHVGDRIYLPGDQITSNGRLREKAYVVVREVDSADQIVSLSDVYAGEGQDLDAGWWKDDISTWPEYVVGSQGSDDYAIVGSPTAGHTQTQYADTNLVWVPLSAASNGVFPDSTGYVSNNVTSNTLNGTIKLTVVKLPYSPLDMEDETADRAPESFNVTLLADNDVNPNQTVGAGNPFSQPWSVYLSADGPQKASAAVATPLQMYYDTLAEKTVLSKINDDQGNVVDVVGVTGAAQTTGEIDPSDPYQGFVNRELRVGDQERTYPLSFRLTISNRGFFLGIWEGNWSTQRAADSVGSNYFNWMLVQKPVNRITGVPLTTGKAPVVHVNSVNYKYWKQIVREADVLHPSVRQSADSHTLDSHALFNTQNQVALTEDRTYLLTFPHNLTTPRFRYTEELDMIGITSADVVMSGQWVQFSTYGETGPRNYIAMAPGGAYNTGLRIAVLGADVGPSWTSVNPTWNSDGELISNDTNNLNGNIYEGDDIAALGFAVSAVPNPAITPTAFGYRLSGGTLPKGVSFDPATGAFFGTVEAMDYSQPTIIRFTIDAMHNNSGLDAEGVDGEMQGFNSRDFYFRYIPGQTRPTP